MKKIGVFCSSQPVAKKYLHLAAQIGEQIAKTGNVLIWGGGKKSMMGAVAEAVIDNNGVAIGYIPKILLEKEQAADYATELIITEDMSDRKKLMIENSDAFIVLPGGIGTMEELAQVWTAAYIGEHKKPIIILNFEKFYDFFMDWVNTAYREGFIAESAKNSIVVVPDPTLVIKTINNL